MTVVALTGGSGHLGRLVAQELLKRVDAATIVVTTRDPSKLGDLSARGVQVRAGDFGDPAALEKAFAGVDRLLIVSTDTVGQRVEGHKRAIDAAAAAGVGHALYTSIVRPAVDHPSLTVPTEHRQTEEHLRASGMTWTGLRNSVYTETLLRELPAALARGTWYTNKGGGGASYVTRADCARAAAAILARGGHENAGVDVTGPAAVTAAEVGEAAREVTGKPLEVVEIDDDTAAQNMIGAGIPEVRARALASFSRGIREGWLSTVTDAVRTLSGTPATSVREFLQASRAELLG
jgi:NAD(P)H dehydrogenase (quinone)